MTLALRALCPDNYYLHPKNFSFPLQQQYDVHHGNYDIHSDKYNLCPDNYSLRFCDDRRFKTFTFVTDWRFKTLSFVTDWRLKKRD